MFRVRFLGVAALLGLVALAVSGCSTEPQPYVHVCPDIVTYSHSVEWQAGMELDKLPASDPLAKMVEDYIALRKAVKDCK